MSEYISKATPSSSPSALPLAPLPASAPQIVSEQMVAAGVAVLWASGAVEGSLGSDELLVAEIFEAMSLASSARKSQS